MIWLAVVIFALTLIADRAYGQEDQPSWWRYVEDEWKPALIEHQANPPHEHHIHLPTQFRGLGGVEQWRALISAYFQPGQVETALCVIQGESRGDPSAKNPTSSAAGLWQFIHGTWDWIADRTGGPSYETGAPYDPETATRYAYELWSISGWAPWNAARRC